MKRSFGRKAIARTAAAAAVLAAATTQAPTVASAKDDDDGSISGRYATGDFHNHTTCSDGSLSLQKLVDKSVNTFGLDWFVQAGHGGNSARNCTLAEVPLEPVPPALGLTVPPTYPSGGQPASSGKGPNQTWVSTLPGGIADIKGDNVLQGGVRSMWKWQEIQEFIYPVLEQETDLIGKPIFVGNEQNTPGHEHTSTAIIDGQLPETGTGNANAMAMHEYCFDRNDNDRSRGATNQWDCSVPGSTPANFNDAAKKIIVPGGAGSGNAGHAKTLEGIKWMKEFAAKTSYFVPAHLERAGAFNPNGNNGFNIEHLRDFHNLAPAVAFGFESMPGHQADDQRGSYSPNAVGGGTYGGTGIYAAAVGGVWDALLGEGRGWWFFASSDYHNRGSFGPDQLESTADFYPGEYTKDYVAVDTVTKRKHRFLPFLGKDGTFGPQEIVDGLRSGNSYVVNGDLIDRFAFAVCRSRGAGAAIISDVLLTKAALTGETFRHPHCAAMGETLEIRSGDDVTVQVLLRDPQGKNNSPYSFANPSLRQINVTQPLDRPVLDHVDLIGGKVTGLVPPTDLARYAGPIGSPAATNPSAKVLATFNKNNWDTKVGGWRKLTFRLKKVTADQYVRLRGTNLPAAVPFETDSAGNPLLDFGADLKIPCTDGACPAHMVTTAAGQKTSSRDVAAWADLWFYSNPVFIKIK
jgi:hypothetical protein